MFAIVNIYKMGHEDFHYMWILLQDKVSYSDLSMQILEFIQTPQNNGRWQFNLKIQTTFLWSHCVQKYNGKDL